MNKKQKALIITGSILGTAILSSAITYTTVYFMHKSKKYQSDEIKKTTKPNVIEAKNMIKYNEKINYVALGDSISAGYTNFLPSDHPGDMDENGNITGASFPSYLAQLIKNENPERLASYKNFAISGATSHEFISAFNWNYLPKHNITPTDGGPKKDFAAMKEQIIEAVKKANLISISFGANDFFEILETLLKQDRYKTLLDDFKNDKAKAIFNIWYLMGEITDEIKNRIDTLLTEIKKINNKANIMMVSYPMPFNRLTKVIDSIILGLSGISNSAINILNQQIIKAAALQNGVQFLNVYDQEYWNLNQSKLSKSVIDIHPTLYGWKKMAMDAYLKLTTGYTSKEQFDYEQYDLEGIFHKLPWSQDFVKEDEAQKVIDTTKSYSEIIYQTFKKKNYEEFLYSLKEEDDPIFNGDEVELEWKNGQIIRHKTGKKIRDIYTYKQTGKRLKSHTYKWTIDKVLENLDSWEIFKQLADNENSFKKLMSGKTNGKDNKELFRELFDVPGKSFIENLLNNFQEYFDHVGLDGEPIWKEIDKNSFFKHFLVTILDGENNYKNLIAPFLKSDLYKQNKNEWIKIVSALFNKFNDQGSKFIRNIIDLYFDFIYNENDPFSMKKDNAKKYFLKVFNNKNINVFLMNIIEYLIKNDNNDALLEKNSFHDVIATMIQDSTINSTFKANIEKLLMSFINDKEYVNLLAEKLLLYKLDGIKNKKHYINDPDNILGLTDNDKDKAIRRVNKYFDFVKRNKDGAQTKLVDHFIKTIATNKRLIFIEKFFHQLDLKTLLSPEQYEEIKKI